MSSSRSFEYHQERPAEVGSGIFLALDAEGGIQLNAVKPGTVLEVATRNTLYTLIPQESGETLMWGHPDYCPEPVLLSGVGSTYLTGLFREGYIGNGLRLTFPMFGRQVFTSCIASIKAKRRS